MYENLLNCLADDAALFIGVVRLPGRRSGGRQCRDVRGRGAKGLLGQPPAAAKCSFFFHESDASLRTGTVSYEALGIDARSSEVDMLPHAKRM